MRQAQERLYTQDSWSGSVFLWGERGLFLGAASATSVHAPHAIKVCISAHGSFWLRTNVDAGWHECEAVIVPPDQPHQIDGKGNMLALFYLMPETEEGQRLLKCHSGHSISPLPQTTLTALLPRLRRQLDNGCESEEAFDLFDELVYKLAPSPGLSTGIDRRVASAAQYLRLALDHQVKSEEIAAAVSLSPSRIAHLFREQAGVPLRRYMLWLRLCAAIEQMAVSNSLTDAAHAAGFSDSAHLSRTFRRMHGIAPSAIFQHSQFIQGER